METLQGQLESAEKTLDHTRVTLAERQQEQEANAEMLARAEEIEKAYADWQAARANLEAMDELAGQFRQHEALRHEPLAAIQAEEARLTQELESLTEQQAALEKAQAEGASLEEQLTQAKAQVERFRVGWLNGSSWTTRFGNCRQTRRKPKPRTPAARRDA